MSQDIFATIDPTISGTELATTLNAFKDAVASGFSGTSRPTNINIGGYWIDTTNDPTSWSFKVWTGTTDIVIFTINLTTGLAGVSLAVDSFLIEKISGDTAQAVLELVKQRIANNGQVLNNDVVGEIRMIGRTNTSDNPVVAKIVWTAGENQTSSASGGTLSFYSTPAGAVTAIEHLRFAAGVLETVVPHKLNSQILVSNAIATAATIVQLSASKVLVELTGSTATAIQGINSGNDSKVVTIHNRSTAIVTVQHENSGAASADQIKMPNGADYQLNPDNSITLYYSTTDSLWKVLYTSDRSSGTTVTTFYGNVNSFATGSASAVKIRTYKRATGMSSFKTCFLDDFGNAYSWGLNVNGQNGQGTVTPVSSPVAVLGGLTFLRTYGSSGSGLSNFGINNLGQAYAWGANAFGQAGNGGVVPQSSPVAVLGGLHFTELTPIADSIIGLSQTGFAYCWGRNTQGQLGLGSVAAQSSPVAVLGAHRFVKTTGGQAAAQATYFMGLDYTGTLYSWGDNSTAQLGTGDLVPRSSPVAVLGSKSFAQIYAPLQGTTVMAIQSDGTVYGWGANPNGELASGDVVGRSSPVAILGGFKFASITSGTAGTYFFGLDASGKAFGWGRNDNGCLGLGDVAPRSSPVAVLGGFLFKKIVCADLSTFGIASDGTLYSWGTNTSGLLAVGDNVHRSSPVAVLGGLKFSDVSISQNKSTIYGQTTDGILYSWGLNAAGEIGDGTVVAKSSPTLVIGPFAPDAADMVKTFDLTVTAQTTYALTIGAGTCYFGSTVIGRDVYKVDVEVAS